MYAWGDNYQGQLGLGDRQIRSLATVVPDVSGVSTVAAGNWHSLALINDGTVLACGYTDNRDTFTVVPGLKDVASMLLDVYTPSP